jgi:hypothetical protein
VQYKTGEIKNIILEIERKFPVDGWIVKGIHVWPLLRIRLSMDLFFYERTETIGKARNSGMAADLRMLLQLARSNFNFVRAALEDRKSNAEGYAPVQCLFLTYTVHRAFLREAWSDKYCDPFIDGFSSLNMESLVLEMSSKGEYRIPRSRKSRFIQPSIDWIFLKNRLFGGRLAEGDLRLPGYSGFVDHLKTRCPGVPPPGDRELHRLVQVLLSLSGYFKNILERVKPSLVFIAEYYSIFGSSLILACRDCGIKTVDIQHGIQGEDHMAYSSFTKIPRNGYEVLPSIFWCWSDYEAGVIKKWSSSVPGAHEPFVGGDLWRNAWQRDNDTVKRYDDLIGEIRHGTNGSKVILFTTSMLEDLNPWVLEAIRSSPARYHWWIRIHPCRHADRDIVKRMLKDHSLDGVEVDRPTDMPLLALLRHADVNVTAYSSTVLEAEHFGVPSVIIDPTGETLFPDQMASGCAMTAFTAEALFRAIEIQAGRREATRNEPPKSSVDNTETIKRFLELHAPEAGGRIS